MTILSIACTKLLCTNAHLGRRRVAAHHFKVYICGSRNGIAILDSDKTLICLRTALHFIGSPIRQKCRSFLLKTNHLFRYEILEEMTSCINASQWKIGSNYLANKIKFRSRTKKISFGLNQQPDCAFILNADRKSSVILEADRSQIPIAFLVDSTSPWESQKRITYPIPANDPIQYMYLFRHSITKTGILERPRIPAMSVSRRGTAAPTWRTGRGPYSSSSHSSPRRKKYYFILLFLAAGGFFYFFSDLTGLLSGLLSYLTRVEGLLEECALALAQWVGLGAQLLWEELLPLGDRPLPMRAEQAKSCSSGLTDPVVGPTILKMDADDRAGLPPIQQSLPPVNSPEGRTPTPPTASHLPMEPSGLQGPPVLRGLDDLNLPASSGAEPSGGAFVPVGGNPPSGIDLELRLLNLPASSGAEPSGGAFVPVGGNPPSGIDLELRLGPPNPSVENAAVALELIREENTIEVCLHKLGPVQGAEFEEVLGSLQKKLEGYVKSERIGYKRNPLSNLRREGNAEHDNLKIHKYLNHKLFEALRESRGDADHAFRALGGWAWQIDASAKYSDLYQELLRFLRSN